MKKSLWIKTGTVLLSLIICTVFFMDTAFAAGKHKSAEEIIDALEYSDDRSDYKDLSAAKYANFREVRTTGIKDNTLYRTSSPINPAHNRNAQADRCLKKAKVTVVMNLADDENTAKGYEGYYRTYYSSAKHIFLNMDSDFGSEDFEKKLVKGMKFFARNPGVYAIHCTEGKDRAGFVAAILECLTGASYEEVTEDYMKSFDNYYGIDKKDERYELILKENLVKSLRKAFGTEDLEGADLEEEAAEYLRILGMKQKDIDALKDNLQVPMDEAAEDAAQMVIGALEEAMDTDKD